ncbi:hypothetical protein GGX14DRAFT_600646, partial [Mycena pura]
KTVMIMSIILQSVSEHCNRIQAILGIFFHSVSVPEKVVETLAHAGLSISLTSIHRSVTSLSIKSAQLLKSLVRTLTAAFAYDNIDYKFSTSQPTVEHTSSFVSATTATAMPLFDVNSNNISSLKCADDLWDKDPLNPSPNAAPMATPPEADLFFEFHLEDTDGRRARDEKLSPRLKRLAWHVCEILLRYGAPDSTEFKALLKELGTGPSPVELIPLHKTTQVPARAMKIKQSTTDGNIQVVDQLHIQGGIGEPDEKSFRAGEDTDMTGWVLIFHGDLLTKERLDSVRASRAIEHSQKARFQHIIFVPGLFHYKMACADAL